MNRARLNFARLRLVPSRWPALVLVAFGTFATFAFAKTYLSNFDPSFIGGTGKPDTLAAVRKNYGIVATRVVSSAASGGSGGYAVEHSSSVYLIDADGRLRAMMPYGHNAADYVHDVQLLLKK